MTGRRISLVLCIALLVSGMGQGGWGTPVPGLAQDAGVVNAVDYNGDVADVSVFYEPLAPYGTWTALPEYGQVWLPRGVPAGWRPYTEGRWVYTEQGWTWVSAWEWGWAPFHYGRWTLVAGYGWVWVPGTVWGPAWVAWRHAPGWVGWAPLPPQVVVTPGVEITVATTAVPIAPAWFCFVEERRILAPHVVTYIAPPVRNVSLIQITQNVTHYTVVQNRVVNRGIPVERIERVMARPVPRLHIVETHAPEAMHGPRIHERAREVVVFRPHVGATVSAQGAALPPVARATVPGSQTLSTPPSVQHAPGTTIPQQQDARRRWLEQQTRERAVLEERQRHAPPPQGPSPEELRQRHEAERRAQEDRARQARQQPVIQQPAIQQQQLQQWQAHQQQLQQQQAMRQQQLRQQQLQQQAQERQRVSQPQPPAQPPLQQRTVLQPHYQQPPSPQGAPPAVSQQQRAADAKEQRKQHQPHPPQQQSSQQ